MSNFIERSECPACHHKLVTLIYELPEGSEVIHDYLNDFYSKQGGVEIHFLKGWNYQLYRCNECSLVFQKSILNDDMMEILYERWIDPTIAFEESKKHHLDYYLNLIEEIGQVIQYFKKKPCETFVMDFGMGWAEWCKIAASLGCNVIGVELSNSRREYARKCNINVVNMDEIERGKLDFINTEQVFEHIPNPLETLQELTSLVKPGGLIKISVPDGYRLNEVLKLSDWKAPKGTLNSLNMVAPLEHINCFNFKSIIRMAELSGLTLISELVYHKYPKTIFDVIKNKYRPLFIQKIRKNKGTYLFLQKN